MVIIVLRFLDTFLSYLDKQNFCRLLTDNQIVNFIL